MKNQRINLSQLFGPQANWMARTFLIGTPILLLLIFVVAEAVDDSGYVTGENIFKDQPVPFSHQHHVGELKVDCRYCHIQVENSALAVVPPASVCLTCHSQIWKNAPMLSPVHASAAKNEPIHWQKVTEVPQFVYFNHSIHISKGVACTTCHGDVSTMPLTREAHPMHMKFCVDCHRDPAPHLRPQDEIFSPEKSELSDDSLLARGKDLMQKNNVHPSTDCFTCHR